MNFLTKDCRVKIPEIAQRFLIEENARRRATNTERVLPITLVVEAILRAGIESGGWQDIVKHLANKRYAKLTPRGRQPKKK